MRTRYRALAIALISVIIAAWFVHNGQYKLDPLQAARASSLIGKDAQLLGQVDFAWGKFYLFKTSKGPRSVLVTKTGFLWQNQGSLPGRENADPVKTLCWQRVIGSYRHEATILAVNSEDDRVAFIEAGTGSERIRKEVKPGSLVIFAWEKALELVEVKAVALSPSGKVLYEFRYPRNKASVSAEDLRWYSTPR